MQQTFTRRSPLADTPVQRSVSATHRRISLDATSPRTICC